MPTVVCPHCGESNEDNAAFCAVCGKALPKVEPHGPRVIEGQAEAATSAGRALQSDELRKQLRKASVALLVVAILQWVFGTVLLLIIGRRLPTYAYASVYVIGLFFFGLYLWARRNPLPAAICGLVLFVTVHLLDALADPTALARGIVVKIIIIVVLVQAISAGARYRKLQRQMVTG